MEKLVEPQRFISALMAEKPRGFAHVYVHLPFCETICHYCDFFVARARGADQAGFFSSLLTEIEAGAPLLAERLNSIFLGGGTPSESSPEDLRRIIAALQNRCDDNTEICLEANPTSITLESLEHWRVSGFERISIGVQSLQDPLLKRLGRTHSRAVAAEAVRLAARVFPRVSCDLIYGVPGQTTSQPALDAQELSDLGATHISAYTLTLEPDHFLYRKLPSDDDALEQSLQISAALAERGFRHYEASNYALPSKESRHNHCYWEGRAYLGFGPSAHSYDGETRRWRNPADLKDYANRVASRGLSILESETLGPAERHLEFLLTRLRTARGFQMQDLEFFAGASRCNATQQAALRARIAETLGQWAGAGFGQIAENSWAPSSKGMMLADELALSLSKIAALQ